MTEFRKTIKQIRDLATATDNIYLLHHIDKLEIQIKSELQFLIKQINFINKLKKQIKQQKKQ